MRLASKLAIGCCGLSLVVLTTPDHPHPEPTPPPIVRPSGITPISWSAALRQGITDQSRWFAAASSRPVVVRPSKPRSAGTQAPRYEDGGTVWDRIAACESGGNWSENTGNGYFGGLQEDMSFWRSYASRVTVVHDDGSTTQELIAPRPDLASREEQIAAAERARDSGRGYSPWPVCGKRA